jgi:biopolymer transport protein ExbB/TolQ
LTHANKGPDEIDAALSEKLGDLKPAVEKRIGALWSLANIATLIGLLGTVSGLIHTFGAVAAQGLSQSDKQRILSNGIAEAMYNTAFGLAIAVTCMIAHVILHTRSKNIQHDLEGTMERVFNLLTITNRPATY